MTYRTYKSGLARLSYYILKTAPLGTYVSPCIRYMACMRHNNMTHESWLEERHEMYGRMRHITWHETYCVSFLAGIVNILCDHQCIGCIHVRLYYGMGSLIPWMITGKLFDPSHCGVAVSLAMGVGWTLFIISTPLPTLLAIPKGKVWYTVYT